MKQNIALIYGGYSSEWEISVKSGKNVAKNIDRTKYNVYEILLSRKSWAVQIDGSAIEIDKSDFSFTYNGEKIKFDKAFIMIHGTPGENGLLQAYFEMIELKHTGCSSRAATLAFDKFACKTYLKEAGINLAKDMFLRRGDKYSIREIIDKLGLPLFVKPNQGGSSFGVTKVKTEAALGEAIELAFKEDDSVLVEEFISGREMTNGIFYDGKNLVALPVTEIISKNEYFDYEAKYLGESQEVCPADIPDAVTKKIQESTKIIYHRFGCEGLVRMDYILHGEDVVFLEINPIPGMTEASLVPVQVRTAGMDMMEFITTIIEN
jgi:D-alanine-D-alanine ligase